ncbi:Rne/Rng family ribonuclease [Jannaschia sp. LMIT008]|uniref:Rne/Rng family ribonuclease n=1 Tax=Jannaschia maritima TaxID=3032585 RepID=UPI0028115780|nr:Rne/Rng family ribonuclease [Jannaschia sp. LMIT008]
MAKKMLIDATHPEETRVVVADGNKVEEFDFESLNKRQLAGNIYLAKVTRVEPSLQAAFIDYGGNRHGFLAFSEIHPDYYQIPKADRDALLAEERAYAEALAARESAMGDEEADDEDAASDDDDAPAAEDKPKRKSRTRSRRKKKDAPEEASPDAPDATDAEGAGDASQDASPVGDEDATAADASDEASDGPDVETVIREEAATETGIVSGGAADVSEAAEAEGSDRPDSDPEADPDRTIAESAGLEDKTLSEGDDPEDDGAATDDVAGGDAPADAASGEDATPHSDAPAQDASNDVSEAPDGAAEEPSGPSGMDVVDLDGGAQDDAAPVEDPTPRKRSRRRSRKDAADKDSAVQTVADDDETDDIRVPPKPRARKYKIQEVVKVRQIMLVQVVKEERGNKGAALTTYLSLAGRYCVLMPNTARGGGISRKITNAADRKKLKEIAQEIDVPQGAGLIVRTAGAKRTKSEIKRDYEYLQRQWEQVRELTLNSIAPAPIYEEGNLIHRSIRDLYNRDIDEVVVAGEAGFLQARDYMTLIMPTHAKNVRQHDDPLPLFAKHGVENYLDSMFNPTVQLKSGGYIVIGITEALVAIDVNSGKATKEGSIEDTATKTNLEAAEEVARQFRLRDLAGLIVIDFIDMDERKNNAAVEKRLKDSLKNDRARIQMGRISGFGLLEMSRQRLRPGMLEATTQPCAHCHGTGLIRSNDSLALQVLRALEEEGTRKRSREVLVKLPVQVANYLMNEKREHLALIETRYAMAVRVEADPALSGEDHQIEKFKTATRQVPKAPANVVQTDTSWTSTAEEGDEAGAEAIEGTAEDVTEDTPTEPEAETEADATAEDDRPKKKRRRRSRRRKGGGNGDDLPSADGDGDASATAEGEATPTESGDDEGDADAQSGGDAEDKPRGRGRSRTRSRRKTEPDADQDIVADAPAAEAAPSDAPAGSSASDTVETPSMAEDRTGSDASIPSDPQPEPEAPAEAESAKPKRRTRTRAKAPAPSPEVVEAANAADAAADAPADEGDDASATAMRSEAPEKPTDAAPDAAGSDDAQPDDAGDASDEAAKPKRRGWWSALRG